jgi:hypothetical protein
MSMFPAVINAGITVDNAGKRPWTVSKHQYDEGRHPSQLSYGPSEMHFRFVIIRLGPGNPA